MLRFQLVQKLNRIHVHAELGLGSAFAQMLVRDAEIVCGRWKWSGMFRTFRMQPLNNHIIGQAVFCCRIDGHRLRGEGRTFISDRLRGIHTGIAFILRQQAGKTFMAF